MSLLADHDHGCNAPAGVKGTLASCCAARRRKRYFLFAAPASGYPVRVARCHELLGFALGLCLPWLTAAAIFRIGRWWSKTIALIAVIPLLLYSAVFLLGSAMTGFAYKNGRDLSFDRFAEAHWKGSEVRFYRTDGGATTDFGVVIRQERGLIPGVVLVRRLDDFYPCYALDAASTDVGIAISDGRSECRGFQEQRRDYRLKPFLYF